MGLPRVTVRFRDRHAIQTGQINLGTFSDWKGSTIPAGIIKLIKTNLRLIVFVPTHNLLHVTPAQKKKEEKIERETDGFLATSSEPWVQPCLKSSLEVSACEPITPSLFFFFLGTASLSWLLSLATNGLKERKTCGVHERTK